VGARETLAAGVPEALVDYFADASWTRLIVKCFGEKALTVLGRK
jgi:hypothetical protein